MLDIGCGTGLMTLALAREGAHVTALDFSSGMLARLREEIPKSLASRIDLVQEDWMTADIKARGWEQRFDLVVAFMSPGVATPDAFARMMACATKGCAVRGWAARQQHAILLDLWKKIMDRPLEDKPQSILFKINYLFSLGLFPDICFDLVEWDQMVDLEKELENQVAFFSKVSGQPGEKLEPVIRDYLTPLDKGRGIRKKQKGLTATAVFYGQADALTADALNVVEYLFNEAGKLDLLFRRQFGNDLLGHADVELMVLFKAVPALGG